MSMQIDRDLLNIQQARSLVESAAEAQKLYLEFSQEEIDRICSALAKAGEAAAADLACLAVQETGMGVVEDKIFKNTFASRNVWENVKDMKTMGIIEHDRENGVLRIAEPVGVIAALVPVTNPTATVIFKSIIALKTKNAIVFAPHPRGYKCVVKTAELMEKVAVSAGAPPGLIGCLSEVSMAATNELIRHRHVSLVLATGGGAMVKVVYSAGKPAIGVGPGNVPVYVDRNTKDLQGIIEKILASKTFDNGTACASEQTIVAHRDIDLQLRRALKEAGAYFLNELEKRKLAGVALMAEGGMNPEIVGQSIKTIIARAALSVPANCRLLVAEIHEVGRKEPFSAEILAPIIAYNVVDDWKTGLRRCNELLEYGGLGHTCALYSDCERVIAAFAAKARAYRVVVNGPSLFGAMGYTTGFEATFMLGTGTLGGSITADNIGPRHLLNIKKVGFPTKNPARE